ncbi:MAG: DUF2062 domain-containing protein [Gammaproteobacteria bacterium]|nr:DUF2062 domain-containing protein [Gammaproteobacteria bacterium]
MRKHLKRFLPDHESVRRNRLLGPLRHVLGDPRLWHINRRGISLGLAIGLFFGLLIPIAQILFAAAAAIALRANVPAAVLSTLVTNPFTFAPIYVLAYKIGAALLGAPVDTGDAQAMAAAAEDAGGSLRTSWTWLLTLGKPLALGLLVAAVSVSVLAYGAAQLLWRVGTMIRARHRRRRGPGRAKNATNRERGPFIPRP